MTSITLQELTDESVDKIVADLEQKMKVNSKPAKSPADESGKLTFDPNEKWSDIDSKMATNIDPKLPVQIKSVFLI